MGDTATKVLSRILFGEPTPTQLTAKINQVCGGSFADIKITLNVTASMFSPERTTEQLQGDIRQAVDEKYGVKGIPALFIETDHQGKDGTGGLIEDIVNYYGKCSLCDCSLTEQEYKRRKLYEGRCHNCFKDYAN